MTHATVRASAQAMPKSAPKRDPLPTAADLRQHAADLRSAVALLEAAKIVERQLAEPNKERAAADDPAQPTTASLRRQTADPVFALIERHRLAWKRFGVDCDLTDCVLAKMQGREITDEDEARRDASDKAESAALAELMATPPMTKAGVRAVIAYFVEWDSGCLPEDSGRYMRTLLRSPIFATA